MTSVQTSVQTIDRLGAILACFSCQQPVLGLSQIARQVSLSKSTVHRLLAAMEHNGLLRRVPEGYALGYQMLHWAAIAQSSLDIRQQSRPFLETLNHQTGETSVLMVRDGQWAVCLDRIDSLHPLRLSMTIGERTWLHAGSSAKVLLAYLDPPILADILQQELPQLLPNTLTDPVALSTELETIRQQGYAVSVEERDAGAVGVTAPIFDNEGDAIAAIGVVGPVSRLTPDARPPIIKLVTELSRQLSTQLGFRSTESSQRLGECQGSA